MNYNKCVPQFGIILYLIFLEQLSAWKYDVFFNNINKKKIWIIDKLKLSCIYLLYYKNY